MLKLKLTNGLNKDIHSVLANQPQFTDLIILMFPENYLFSEKL